MPAPGLKNSCYQIFKHPLAAGPIGIYSQFLNANRLPSPARKSESLKIEWYGFASSFGCRRSSEGKGKGVGLDTMPYYLLQKRGA